MTARRRVILVVGPPLAGVDGVLAAVRAELPGCDVIGVAELAVSGAPDAVVAVVSAVAPLVRSDWALIERAAARTDLVLGAVSKTDAHRGWREVLSADRDLVSGWSTPRRGPASWVGVAAAPHLGEPNVTELVAELTVRLDDRSLNQRNMLRRADCDRLRERERERARRPAHARAATGEARVALARARLGLLRFVRDGCAALRAELRDAAATVPAGGVADFEARVRRDVAGFAADVDEEITRVVAELGEPEVAEAGSVGRSHPPAIAAAPLASGRLETRLMVVLGVGFGLGVALAASRLLTGLAPELSVAWWGAGGVLGAAVVLWVVRARGLLHDRALLDRWVGDVAAAVKWHGEAAVAERLLAVEDAFHARSARRPGGG